MKNFLRLSNLIAIPFITFLVSCSSDSPWAKKCPFERLDWMEVSSGYNSKDVIDLAAKIEAAAKADAEALKKGVSADGSTTFTSSLNKVVENSSTKRTIVSQEFYQTYITQRTATCTIWKVLEDDLLKTPGARQRGEQLFLDIASNFAGLKNNLISKAAPSFEFQNYKGDSIRLIIKNPTQLDYIIDNIALQYASVKKKTGSIAEHRIIETKPIDFLGSVNMVENDKQFYLSEFPIRYGIDSLNTTAFIFSKKVLLDSTYKLNDSSLKLIIGLSSPQTSIPFEKVVQIKN
jgi:hypothetical protein